MAPASIADMLLLAHASISMARGADDYRCLRKAAAFYLAADLLLGSFCNAISVAITA